MNQFSEGYHIDMLIKKTPNVKFLKTLLKQFYSVYSEIAHSSNPKVLELLGRKEIDGECFSLLYPEYQKNSYVVLNHHALCVYEYYIWMLKFLSNNFDDYSNENDSLLFNDSMELFKLLFND